MGCPLCDCGEADASWLGQVAWHDKTFNYVKCARCGSLYCESMPTAQDLAQMYGPEYQDEFYAPSRPVSARSNPAIRWLKKRRPGVFLDYGCGSGTLLQAAADLKWEILGVEFDAEVAQSVAERTGARVVTDPAQLDARADVLHLGDVLEHLTQMNEQMPQILKLLKPGGVLLAQGPLENNASLFTSAMGMARSSMRLMRRLRGREQVTQFAPYHVMLATAPGQRLLFERFGLKEELFVMNEVAWPAPARLMPAQLKNPRSVALWLLRRMSQMVSRTRPQQWGNRYFYAGRWHGEESA